MPYIGWAHAFNIWLTIPPTCPLRLVIPDNARHPRVTAAAGTELAVAYSCANIYPYKLLIYTNLLTQKRTLHTEMLLRPRGVALSDFRPL